MRGNPNEARDTQVCEGLENPFARFISAKNRHHSRCVHSKIRILRRIDLFLFGTQVPQSGFLDLGHAEHTMRSRTWTSLWKRADHAIAALEEVLGAGSFPFKVDIVRASRLAKSYEMQVMKERILFPSRS